jgi:hypothetical protein
MITNAFIYILYLIVYGITAPLRLFNDVSLDSSFLASVTTASDYISAFNTFLPLTALLSIFGLFLAFESSYFTYKLIMWIVRKIPMIN